MGSYLLRRLLIALPTFLGMTFLVYALVRSVPATPAAAGPEAVARLSPEDLAEIRSRYGLDRSIPAGYLEWMGRLARLDLGRSFGPDRTPVARLIADRLPATLLLNGSALLLALGVALPLGIASAARARGALDRAAGVTTFVLYSMPAFWLALMLQALLATRLKILPLHYMSSSPAPEGLLPFLADRAAHLLLPTLCLALNDLAFLSRFVRASVLEQAGQDFVRTARAKGLSRARVLWCHAVRAGLTPLVTLLGFLLPGLIGGTVIIESLFDWNGVGLLFLRSVAEYDLNVILALTALTGLLVLAGTLAADLLYAWVDPRVRYRS
jgi:peptide/nickel transport system permease protein